MSARADNSIHVGIELAGESTHSAMMSAGKRGAFSASRKQWLTSFLVGEAPVLLDFVPPV
jgi:hypothetical protein